MNTSNGSDSWRKKARWYGNTEQPHTLGNHNSVARDIQSESLVKISISQLDGRQGIAARENCGLRSKDSSAIGENHATLKRLDTPSIQFAPKMLGAASYNMSSARHSYAENSTIFMDICLSVRKVLLLLLPLFMLQKELLV